MILFIDDEPDKISGYVQAFELSDYEVKILESIDDAYEFVEYEYNEITGIVLDVMMPTGIGLEIEDTKGGLETGIHFLKWLDEKYNEIPIILLTNTVYAEKKFKVSHQNCIVHEKKNIGPWGLLEKMGDMKKKKR